ncbi:hypothetical protein NE237_018651 [Protea cynaroides]|uniref:Uncharacterized protein n=1 Tax=Protea cynaroides TaxID=273540 RepID=A0A9Q0KAD4_9MAGN|nr:hypothetical protein NE237_018651 [Protea cynaroides]
MSSWAILANYTKIVHNCSQVAYCAPGSITVGVGADGGLEPGGRLALPFPTGSEWQDEVITSFLLDMAKIKLVCTCFFILVLLSSNEILSAEGRHMRSEKKMKCMRCIIGDRRNTIRKMREGNRKNSKSPNDVKTPQDIESFRPTAPGHSPGIGHSIQH